MFILNQGPGHNECSDTILCVTHVNLSGIQTQSWLHYHGYTVRCMPYPLNNNIICIDIIQSWTHMHIYTWCIILHYWKKSKSQYLSINALCFSLINKGCVCLNLENYSTGSLYVILINSLDPRRFELIFRYAIFKPSVLIDGCSLAFR